MKEGSNLELKVVEIRQYGSWQIVVLQVERGHRTQKKNEVTGLESAARAKLFECLCVCQQRSKRTEIYYLQENSELVWSLRIYDRSTLAMYWMRSTMRLEYPHSLSYQETSLTKCSLRAIPALASKTEEYGQVRRSRETMS